MFCFHQGQTIRGLEPGLSRKEADSDVTILEERAWTNIKKIGDRNHQRLHLDRISALSHFIIMLLLLNRYYGSLFSY